MSEWISAEERLPGRDVYVLGWTTWSDENGEPRGDLVIAKYEHDCAEHPDQCDLCVTTSDGGGLTHLTHWMPLPEPPRQ